MRAQLRLFTLAAACAAALLFAHMALTLATGLPAVLERTQP